MWLLQRNRPVPALRVTWPTWTQWTVTTRASRYFLQSELKLTRHDIALTSIRGECWDVCGMLIGCFVLHVALTNIKLHKRLSFPHRHPDRVRIELICVSRTRSSGSELQNIDDITAKPQRKGHKHSLSSAPEVQRIKLSLVGKIHIHPVFWPSPARHSWLHLVLYYIY